MTKLYWGLKAVDGLGLLLVLIATASEIHWLARLFMAAFGWLIASVCASLEEQWKARGWLVKVHAQVRVEEGK